MTLTASDLNAALARAGTGWERELRPLRPPYVELDMVTRDTGGLRQIVDLGEDM